MNTAQTLADAVASAREMSMSHLLLSLPLALLLLP